MYEDEKLSEYNRGRLSGLREGMLIGVFYGVVITSSFFILWAIGAEEFVRMLL